MSDLEALRDRVTAAQECLGQAGEQRRQQSAQLAALIDSVERALAQKQSEIADFQATIQGLQAENRQLRGLLESLVEAIESTGADEVRVAAERLDSALAAISGAASAEAGAAAPAGERAAEASKPAAEAEPAGPADAGAEPALAEQPQAGEAAPGEEHGGELPAEIAAAARTADDSAAADDGAMVIDAAAEAGELEIQAGSGDEAVIEAAADGIEITADGTADAQAAESAAPAPAGAKYDEPDAGELPLGDPARVKAIIERVSRLADEMSWVTASDTAAEPEDETAETAQEARTAWV